MSAVSEEKNLKLVERSNTYKDEYGLLGKRTGLGGMWSATAVPARGAIALSAK